jgi:hypothetical protein
MKIAADFSRKSITRGPNAGWAVKMLGRQATIASELDAAFCDVGFVSNLVMSFFSLHQLSRRTEVYLWPYSYVLFPAPQLFVNLHTLYFQPSILVVSLWQPLKCLMVECRRPSTSGIRPSITYLRRPCLSLTDQAVLALNIH